MIQPEYLDSASFFDLLRRFSFSSVSGSVSYKGWYERISRSSGEEKAYLIEYLFGEKPWISFLIRNNGTRISYFHFNASDKETVESISKGSILKLCMQLQGKYCLHASGIQVGKKVILFMGPKGAGKSTTAAFFHSKGHRVWCDDYCVLEQKENVFYALPGETRLKVKNETILGLNLSHEKLNPLYASVPEVELQTTPVDKDKAYYTNFTDEDAPERIPVMPGAIFFLQKRNSGPKLILERADKIDGFKWIMDELMLREIVSKEYVKLYFGMTKKLLDNIDFYSVQVPDDISRMDELYTAVLKNVVVENEK